MDEKSEFDIKKVIESLQAFDPDDPPFIRLVCNSSENETTADGTTKGNTEYVLEGNQPGLNQAAAALLRAGYPEDPALAGPPIDEVIYELFDDKTEAYLANVIRSDSNRAEENDRPTIGQRLGNIGCVSILISIPVLWVIGAYTVFLWLLG